MSNSPSGWRAAHSPARGIVRIKVPPYPGRQSPKYSKRDYVSFAKAIRKARETLPDPTPEHLEAINEIIWGLIELFKADNPEFEELRFIPACSITV